MKKISFLFVLLLTALLQIRAEEIELTIDVDVPGTLESKIFDMNQRPLHVTKLTLTGTLDETDFKVMRETMISLHTVDISEITNVEGVNFSNHKRLRRIYLPKKLEILPNNAFSSCSALEDINIPLTVSSIGSSVFSGCSTLDSIVIPNGVVRLADNLFSGCSALKFVDIPENVVFIGKAVFEGCSSLEGISISCFITEISSNLFYGCSALKSIVIPRECEIIQANAFAYCYNLETIVIPSKVKSIRNDVFVGCYNLDTIVCLSIVPPQASELGVDELECVLKVPTIAYDDYIRHSYWGKFYTIETIGVDYKYISVYSNDFTMGVVEGSGYYMIGEEIEIKAISKIGRFVKWDDDCTDNPRVIEIKDSMDVDYQAIFERDTLIEDSMCFNYFDLDREGVTCLVGDATKLIFSSTGLGKYGAGPIDYGESDMRSRHTVNWKQGEYDSRTGNRLRTIPEGSFASVRLGNWEIGGEAEGIEYDYLVDTMGADILLVKYAVVLESPGHGPMDDPYFRIEILDEAGNVVDSRCGDFYFTPLNSSIEWNKCNNFVWRDWSSVGLDLSSYHGQIVKVRFTTQDCTRSAHCGYAYFTLDCMDSEIKQTIWEEEELVKFEAPEGFKYVWTNSVNRDSVISTEQSIVVKYPNVYTYYCEVKNIEESGCSFVLETKIPCMGVENTYIISDTICWGDYRIFDGTCIFVSGTYIDTLVSVVGCDSIVTLDLTVLPKMETYLYDTIYENQLPYTFAEMEINEPGVYEEIFKSEHGCDSIVILNLHVEKGNAVEDVNAEDLVIVPNPIGVDDNAVVKYEWSVEEQDGLMVEIINSLGQRVDVFETKSYPIVLPRVGGVGIYYVRITTGVGSVYVGKLIVEDR